MSSGEEAWQYLHDRTDPFYAALGRRCLQIGSERDLEIRDGLGLAFVETPDEADFILNTGPAGWEDRIADYAPVLEAARDRDLPMVCANPDLVVIHDGRPALCAGALAEHYEKIGGRVRWHGKPHPSVYDSCLALMGIAERRRLLAIGDSLRTTTVRIIAAVGLVQAQQLLALSLRPTAILAGTVRDTLLYSLLDTTKNVSKVVGVKLIHVTADSTVPSYIVSFQIVSGNLLAADLVNEAGKLSHVDTTDATGGAGRQIRLRTSSLSGTDSVVINATAKYRGVKVAGSPVRLVVVYKPSS